MAIGTYYWIPGTCAQADAVVANAQTADTILMAHKGTNLLSSCHIPYLQSVS